MSNIQFLCSASILFAADAGQAAERPNVVLVITDDQGYGDLGCHGNTMLKTPNLDRLHSQSVRLTNFHVDPTCSPTRSALMTGRYSTRTGVWHTIAGKSWLDPDELTLGEIFAHNGYATGQFGKWHLGDNYPLRPHDQGFAETLHHGGGGVTQMPDWWGNDYFDDTYLDERGEALPQQGYCTDVWFDHALEFIEQHREQPFFCYLATNAPHSPYLVEEKYKQPYLEAGVPEPMASFYGMIANLDENMGRLTSALDDWSLADNTILIFMTDNGSAAGTSRGKPAESAKWQGFSAGMRAQKGSEYDGGHRVPFFIRWPNGQLSRRREIPDLTAHIDVLPTLVELCGLKKLDGPPLDGTSLAPLLQGSGDLPERTLFVHSQRVQQPVKWKNCTVMTHQWRLINGVELYDINADPAQTTDIASHHPAVLNELRAGYEAWWESLTPVFDRDVRITLGNEAENPARLTGHDWHGDKVPVMQELTATNPELNGYWSVTIDQPGPYRFTLRMRPELVPHPLPPGTARIRVGEVEATEPILKDVMSVELELTLPVGDASLQTWLSGDDGSERGAYFVEVERLAD